MSGQIEGAYRSSFENAVQSMISRSCIVDYGVITKVLAKGVVYVAISIADSVSDVKYITCTLANIASKTLTIDVVPQEGDKVIVLYPRRFSSDMFAVDDKHKDVVIKENASGYNLMSGIAILCNQFKTDAHKDYIRSEEGKLDIELAYSEDAEKNLLSLKTETDGSLVLNSNDNTVSLNADGELSVKLSYSKDEKKNLLEIVTNKDGAVNITSPNAKIAMDKDGYLSYSNTKDNKSEITFTSSGMTLQDKNGCTITSTSSSIKINGKLEIKK